MVRMMLMSKWMEQPVSTNTPSGWNELGFGRTWLFRERWIINNSWQRFSWAISCFKHFFFRRLGTISYVLAEGIVGQKWNLEFWKHENSPNFRLIFGSKKLTGKRMAQSTLKMSENVTAMAVCCELTLNNKQQLAMPAWNACFLIPWFLA